MQLSDEGAALIIEREGFRCKAYRDSVGVWTIGIGHTSAAGLPKVTPGLVLTVDEVYRTFLTDIDQYVSAVNAGVRVPLTQLQFDALVSLCYNIGVPHFLGSTLVRCLNAGDFHRAPEEIMAWNEPREIIDRRTGERDQFLATGYRPG